MNESTEISVEICFDAYYNLSKLCGPLDSGSDHQPPAVFWLSWNFLDKTFKSDEFRIDQTGPSPLKNTVQFHVNNIADNLVPKDVLQAFPFRIFLCTHRAILAVANVNPFKMDTVDKEYTTSLMPFQISEWVELLPIRTSSSDGNDATEYFKDGQSASIKISLNVKNTSIGEEETSQDYDDDVFELEAEILGGIKVPAPPAPPSPAGTGTASSKLEEEQEEAKKSRVQFQLQQEQEEKAEKEEKDQKEKEEVEKERVLRHYRLSVDLRSIGGLKRPAHVSLSYLYPHLGSSAPIRTKPTWVVAHTETRIDNGAAAYECAMPHEQLVQTFSDHPLKVTALTRSHLGNNILGELNVDLAAVTYVDPHSFRCPLTGKTFKALKDYHKHRQILLALLAAGRVEQAPPKDPIEIRALDSYLVFTSPRPESKSAARAGEDGGKGTPNYVVPLAEGGKLRVVLILEDFGTVGFESAIRVKPGYKMHNGGLYDMYGVNTGLPGAITGEEFEIQGGRSLQAGDDTLAEAVLKNAHSNPLERKDLSPMEKAALERLKVDWEGWRRHVDAQWREAMLQKEEMLKRKLEAESAEQLMDRAEDLRRAQMEAGKLEVRLRGSIEEVERQKAQLKLKEEQMQMRLAQKTSELQLLQRRVRDEAKSLVAAETRRADGLQQTITSVQESFRLMEKRAKDAELDFENYRSQLRSSPESVLREETARLKALLGEARGEVERERRLRSETELEKEHFRAQMHRLAMALKRERERSSTMARQELEQLRLEFLAREERYVLDGDREELRHIRAELSHMRSNSGSNTTSKQPSDQALPKYDAVSGSITIDDFSNAVGEEKHSPSSPSTAMREAENAVAGLKQQIEDLMSTGVYDDGSSDPVIVELKQSLVLAEQRFAQMKL